MYVSTGVKERMMLMVKMSQSQVSSVSGKSHIVSAQLCVCLLWLPDVSQHAAQTLALSLSF